MGIPIYQVDAFTDKPFQGNPAAVCLLPEARDEAWMQHVAAEMNLSETAFLLEQADGFRLRWFTPAAEVDLCGHATLASAHVLWESDRLPTDAPARFHTLSGVLTAERQGDWIEMDFPAQPGEQVGILPEIEMLGTKPLAIRRTTTNYLLELADEATLRNLKPDLAWLKRLPAQGVIVTCRSETPAFDFISRYFAPQVGIDEDPVTGSVHCTLGPYWGQKLGKTHLNAYQASTRGGVLKVRTDRDRVFIGGQAVTVWSGELHS